MIKIVTFAIIVCGIICVIPSEGPHCWMTLLLRPLFYFISPINSSRIISRMSTGVRYLSQDEATQLDVDLFNEYFSVDQLMELAGLSVATAIHKVFFDTHKNSSIVAVAGPGNNGGDAMVAVRHLKLFGFENVTLLNTRQPSKELFINLIHQAQVCGVVISYEPQPFLKNKPSLLVDGLFGFSFKPPVRPELEPFMQLLNSPSVPVVSIDIPSGWDVEKGPLSPSALQPHTLISLSAPKMAASFFKGPFHFLGGRFIPPQMQKKYQLNLPTYPGSDLIIQIN